MRRQQPIDAKQEVLFRRRTVENVTGKARSTIYRDMDAGTFPRPVRLGANSVGWRKSDIDRWIATRPVAD